MVQSGRVNLWGGVGGAHLRKARSEGLIFRSTCGSRLRLKMRDRSVISK